MTDPDYPGKIVIIQNFKKKCIFRWFFELFLETMYWIMMKSSGNVEESVTELTPKTAGPNYAWFLR